MFGSIGVPELVLIFIVALLLFGPRKLPDIGRSLGKAMGEFRRASNDLKRTLEEEVAADQLREVDREVREATRATYQPPAPPATPAAEPAAAQQGPTPSSTPEAGSPETQEPAPASPPGAGAPEQPGEGEQPAVGEKAPPIDPR